MREAYLEADKALSLSLRCIMGEPLPVGSHSVTLLFLPPAQEGSTVDIELRGSAHGEAVTDRIDFREKSRDNSGVIPVNHSLLIDQGFLEVNIKPLAGKALVCAVLLEPRR